MCVLVYNLFKTGFCRCLPLLARSQNEEKKENEIMNWWQIIMASAAQLGICCKGEDHTGFISLSMRTVIPLVWNMLLLLMSLLKLPASKFTVQMEAISHRWDL
jgi:hypothetical protein